VEKSTTARHGEATTLTMTVLFRSACQPDDRERFGKGGGLVLLVPWKVLALDKQLRCVEAWKLSGQDGSSYGRRSSGSFETSSSLLQVVCCNRHSLAQTPRLPKIRNNNAKPSSTPQVTTYQGKYPSDHQSAHPTNHSCSPSSS